ncbi:methyl-accepting chemotaxis protein [Paenalcaligenes hominis]|uniref:methyl-accepting chemotaxis protein n=1 Tax=Paenalcaligenes hominis TaxID=643674 RepID=UPI003525C410
MLNNLKLRNLFALLMVLIVATTTLIVAVAITQMQAVLSQLQTAAVSKGVLGAVQASYTTTLAVAGIALVVVVVFSVAAFLLINGRVLKPLNFLAAHFEAIANGDLTQRIARKSNNEVGQVFGSLQRMQESLIKTFGHIRLSAAQLHAGNEGIAEGNSSLTERIEEQAAALQQTATSMEQLSSTVRQNADNAHQANQLAVTASNVAQRGGQAVGEVVSTMQGISASSSKIADIVGVIDSIAFQTNILALNAAVEAARAGEQGRGFAVVASEVRALAQRSAQAAREITGLIDDSVSKVNEGSGQVERAGATMQEIVDSVKRVTDIMGEISAATIEQSSGIDQVNLAISSMDSSTTYNAERVEETARSAVEMSKQSQALYDALNAYQLPESYVIDIDAQVKNQRAHIQKKTQLQSPAKSLADQRPTSPKVLNGAASALTTSVKKNQNPAEIPGMNASSGTGKDAKLLRPDLSGTKKPQSEEDDWVEF